VQHKQHPSSLTALCASDLLYIALRCAPSPARTTPHPWVANCDRARKTADCAAAHRMMACGRQHVCAEVHIHSRRPSRAISDLSRVLLTVQARGRASFPQPIPPHIPGWHTVTERLVAHQKIACAELQRIQHPTSQTSALY
jgi:hypothetical protein